MKVLRIIDFTSEKTLVSVYYNRESTGAFVVPRKGDQIIVDGRFMLVLSTTFDYESLVVEVCVQ